MASPTQPLGPYVDNNLEAIPGGLLHFLDVNTVVPKTVYADSELTVAADNPITLTSASTTPYQVYLGEGDYLIRLYKLVDPDMVSPVFPQDYAIVRQWTDNGENPAGSGGTVPDNYSIVETIIELTDTVSPNEYTYVDVLGYFAGTDDIDTRTYYWDPLSVSAPDGGAILASTLIGTGRWLLKSSAPRIDVRWFGALPNSGVDCNSAITSALAYGTSGFSTPREVYFVAGTYQVVPGTIMSSTPVEMAEGVRFFNRLAGELLLELHQDFDIKHRASLEHPSSPGEFILDLRNNVWAINNNGLINPDWYESGDECFQYSGGNPVLIQKEVIVDVSADVDGYLVFKSNGYIRTSSSGSPSPVLRVVGIEAQSRTGLRFKHSNSPVTASISFAPGLDIYTAWFDTINEFNFINKFECNLIVNSELSLPVNYNLNLASAASIEGVSGFLEINSKASVNIPTMVRGRCFKCIETLTAETPIIANNTSFSSLNFVMSDSVSLLGFVIASANALEGQVTFNNEVITHKLQLTALYGINIENLVITGEFNFTGSSTRVSVTNSKLLGVVNGGNGTLSCNNSKIRPLNNGFTAEVLSLNNNSLLTFQGTGFTFTFTIFSAFNSSIGELSTGSSNTIEVLLISDIRDCYIGVVDIETLATSSRPVNFRMEGNVCSASTWNPIGTGGIARVLIRRNEFNNTNGLTEYEPIKQASFIATRNPLSLAGGPAQAFYLNTGAGGYTQPPYNFGPIEISDNSPFTGAWGDVANKGTAGGAPYNIVGTVSTKIRQTKFDINFDVDNGTSAAIDILGRSQVSIDLLGANYKFAWMPYTETSTYYAYNASASMNHIIGYENSYEVPKCHVDKLIGKVNPNSIEVYYENIEHAGSVNAEPYSSGTVSIDIFPH